MDIVELRFRLPAKCWLCPALLTSKPQMVLGYALLQGESVASHFGSASSCQQALSSGWMRSHRGAHLSGTRLITVLFTSYKCPQRCVLA